jgi:hypothetical protein
MAKVDEYCELGMATELAKYVAGATGGVAGLSGTFTLNGATNVVVANANLAVGDVVVWSLRTVGGTVGTHPVMKTRTNGTGFAVAGTASDTSIYDYRIMKA